MPEAVIVSALRTPIGTAVKGTLRDTDAFRDLLGSDVPEKVRRLFEHQAPFEFRPVATPDYLHPTARPARRPRGPGRTGGRGSICRAWPCAVRTTGAPKSPK